MFSQQLRARLGQPTIILEDVRGTLSGWMFIEERVVVQLVSGHISTALVEASIKLCERAVSLATGPVLLVDDLANVTSYDSAARVMSVEWGKANQDKIAGVHVLFHSKLVAMAVAVANIALRDPMQTYSAREPFEKRLLEELRAPRRSLRQSQSGAPKE